MRKLSHLQVNEEDHFLIYEPLMLSNNFFLCLKGKKDQALTVDTLIGTEQYVEDLTIK